MIRRCWFVSMSIDLDPSPPIDTGVGPDDDPDPETCVYLFLTLPAAEKWIMSNGYGGILSPVEVLLTEV